MTIKFRVKPDGGIQARTEVWLKGEKRAKQKIIWSCSFKEVAAVTHQDRKGLVFYTTPFGMPDDILDDLNHEEWETLCNKAWDRRREYLAKDVEDGDKARIFLEQACDLALISEATYSMGIGINHMEKVLPMLKRAITSFEAQLEIADV